MYKNIHINWRLKRKNDIKTYELYKFAVVSKRKLQLSNYKFLNYCLKLFMKIN